MSLTVAALVLLQATVVTAGVEHQFATLSEAIASAGPWDTVLVAPGLYREHLVIDKPLVLQGQDGAIIDGGDEGTVITVTAPVTIRGFTIRGSGHDLSREHAGIWIDKADSLVIEHNVLENVLFGVYIKQSDAAVVRHNTVLGKDLPFSRRGDGIRLWYSHNGRVHDNTVQRVRDLVVWFSNDVAVWNNTVTDSRYGLHYMYSDRSWFYDNRFLRNEVGAFLMYSEDITFDNNVFADARGGFGKGLGFKDSERIRATGNIFVKNAVGIYLDNSPYSRGVINVFSDNVIAFNDVGVALLPSVKNNTFEGNEFVDNINPVTVTGGGDALANVWSQNYWSDYAGFDEDRDGRGDAPYVHERVSDNLLAKHEALRLFELSPAIRILNVIGRVYPLLQPSPIVSDSAPRLAALPAKPEFTLNTGSTAGTPWALAFFSLTVAGIGVAVRLRHRRGGVS